jgi:FKBP-type peptidyl-prolyl cis-trans isomerase
VAITALGLALLAGACSAEKPPALEGDAQKLGYSVGFKVASDFRRQGIALEPEVLVQGAIDALQGDEPALTAHEMRQALSAVQRQAAEAQRLQQEELGRRTQEQGRAFLAENRAREGVTTLESGLQYEVLEEGSGPRPDSNARVTVHYRGLLLDGTEFDSSYSRDEPATFPLDSVIAGWQQALPLMNEGAKWKLAIPPDLAYGEEGAGRIPPNATLIFEVELISAQAE